MNVIVAAAVKLFISETRPRIETRGSGDLDAGHDVSLASLGLLPLISFQPPDSLPGVSPFTARQWRTTSASLLVLTRPTASLNPLTLRDQRPRTSLSDQISSPAARHPVRRIFRSKDTERRSPKFLGNPFVSMPRAGLRRLVTTSHTGCSISVFRQAKNVDTVTRKISELIPRGPLTCCLRFNPRRSTHERQGSLPACPLRLWPGRVLTNWIPLRGFRQLTDFLLLQALLGVIARCSHTL
jgi:hypothetical protein